MRRDFNEYVNIDLTGKTALVTGSAQGIGLEIVRQLAASGARAVVNGRSQERVDAAIAEVGLQNGSVIGVAADVSTAEGVELLRAQLPEVDILVNNLGIFGAAPAREITDEQWRNYFEVNVLSAVRLIREYLPGMIDTGWGRIIQIASDSAIVIPQEMIHYGVSKTALLGVTRGFAKDAAGSGVTVNSVIAGPTHTAGVEDFVYQLVDKSLPWDEAQREVHRWPPPRQVLRFAPMAGTWTRSCPSPVGLSAEQHKGPLPDVIPEAALSVSDGLVDAADVLATGGRGVPHLWAGVVHRVLAGAQPSVVAVVAP
ncbi:putative short-chain dehydrogenase/reductase [Mycobacteroides stephanolepidis]|uniref:3-oxoacyl-[acyl-carrier-protein] reductase MabA n=1 Tax=[Mycobacterium] stephanolepidis TaxID=1520670 RepID=A0A1Z4F4S9_9MYCO|nr:putative short-chain dehydrogenase/reductase [[Mycobacterium] stephanolepidis]